MLTTAAARRPRVKSVKVNSPGGREGERGVFRRRKFSGHIGTRLRLKRILRTIRNRPRR